MSEVADFLKSTLTIEEVVSHYIELEDSQNSLSGKCPFHDDSTPSFNVYPLTQSFYCFGCGAGSDESNDLIAFVQKIEDCDFRTAVKILLERYELSFKMGEGAKKLNHIEFQTNLAKKYWFNLQENPDIIEYLEKRGITPEMTKKYRLGCNDNGSAITIGLTDKNNQILGIAYRNLETQPKYIAKNNDFLVNADYLYGEHFARKYARTFQAICVVEGYFDTIMLNEYCIPTVAISTTNLSDKQIKRILDIHEQIILIPDGDFAGENSLIKNYRKFVNSGAKIVKCFPLPAGKDPDDFVNEYQEKAADIIYKGCIPVLSRVIGQELIKYNSSLLQIRMESLKRIDNLNITDLIENVELLTALEPLAESFNINSEYLLNTIKARGEGADDD